MSPDVDARISAVTVAGSADSGVDVPAGVGEAKHRGPADAGRGAGDDYVRMRASHFSAKSIDFEGKAGIT